MEEEKVVLVDIHDQQLGTMGKIEAHEKAELHRAFSIFILNSNGELLLQQRAFEKYHSPGLWTNTCCSHQREGESNLEAGKRRLMEDMNSTTLWWAIVTKTQRLTPTKSKLLNGCPSMF
jgi:isopentenyl-diphosphate delta-isomerase